MYNVEIPLLWRYFSFFMPFAINKHLPAEYLYTPLARFVDSEQFFLSPDVKIAPTAKRKNK